MTKIELKNIKFYGSMSEETYCFEATLYVDGKKVTRVSNRGTGGCHEYGFGWREEEKLDKWCKANLPKWKMYEQAYLEGHPKFDPNGKHEFIDTSLEKHITDLVFKHLVDKDVKRTLKKIAFIKSPSNKQVYMMGTVAQAKERGDQLREKILQDYPTAIILNDLPIEEVRPYFS
jgi:hypothetical protein